MKHDSLGWCASRARYLALGLPLFALFSTVHGGCIRGPAGYGTYGNYGYGNRASALGGDTVEQDEGECVVYVGNGDADDGRLHGGYRYGNCDDGDTYDGYGDNADRARAGDGHGP